MAALSRIHDSKYQGARLVCRPRRGDGSPAARPGATNGLTRSLSTKDQAARDTGGARARGDGSESERVAHRYFIVKSLTVEDLEASRRSGIWATQVQNEDVLNQAFQTADDVYLIFSANKSGEYYGYARMMSSIQENGDPTLQMPFRPRQSVPGSEELNLTATPATTFAPSGRIIRDLGRGTVFWEADSSEGEPEEEEERKEAGADDAADDESPGPEGVEVQSIGRPFRIQWLSAERVPFHRTRGLRNPWNGNRDVKVARDGTEIESTVGERLLGLFHSALPN
ncbi:YTH domain-containing protein [Aspergillus candidus]|uniref:YT521-B-like domain-domain-containing protein n=1 Tax=Aspergillus candidus TaxID=41067 RepID=A0A2I2F7U6_ASPCN|nr:YT521-B-like domain-domain-containing protein [Aspergillus candidus]PLB36700.1 YT521-B-like domain-domain-containing protein [Aspergillus candidus]